MCNDTVMTNKWHSVTGVTNLCPPLHIWPLPLSQTTLVKQDGGAGKTGKITRVPLSEKCLFTFWPTDDNSRLFSALAQIHGRMPTFFHLWPYFHLSHFFPVWVGTEREIDLFDIFWGAPPGYCPPSHCQCTFQFRLWTYNLSVWVILHKYDRRSYCYLHIPTSHFSVIQISSLLFSNIFKLNLIIGDFSEADIRFSHFPFRFEQISREKTFWMDSLINFVTKEIFRISKYFQFENVSKCVFLMNGQTWKCWVNTVNRSQYLSPRKRM